MTGSVSGTDGDVFRIHYFKSSANVTSGSRFALGEELIAWQDVTIVGGTASIDEDISAAGDQLLADHSFADLLWGPRGGHELAGSAGKPSVAER